MKTVHSILLVALLSACSSNGSDSDASDTGATDTGTSDTGTTGAGTTESGTSDTGTSDPETETNLTDSFGPSIDVGATTSLESVGSITLIPTASLTDDDYRISRIALSPDNSVLSLKSFKSGSSEVRLDLYDTDADTLSPLGMKDEFASAAINAEATSLVYVSGCDAFLQTDSESTEPLLLNSFLKTDTCARTGTLDIAADTVLMSVSPGRRAESGELLYDNARGGESSHITYSRTNNRVVSFAKSDVSLNDAELNAMDWETSIPRLSNDGKYVVFHAVFQHNASSGTGDPIIATFATETETSNTIRV